MKGLATLLWASLAFATPNVISSDAFFHNQSPPVYPARTCRFLNNETWEGRVVADGIIAEIKGTDAWGPAFVKARKLASQLTLEEKVTIISRNILWRA